MYNSQIDFVVCIFYNKGENIMKQATRSVLVNKLSKYKKLLVLSMVLALSISAMLGVVTYNTNVAQASELTVQQMATIKAKQDFAKYHLDNAPRLTKSQLSNREDMFYEIVRDDNLNEVDKELLLNQFGYYTFEVQGTKQSRFDTSDVVFSPVKITFDSVSNTWILNSNFALNNLPSFNLGLNWPNVGDEYSYGSNDYAGILLQGTYGDSNGLSIVSGGKLTVVSAHSSIANKDYYNRDANVESRYGAVYPYRDYHRITGVGFLALTYSYTYNTLGSYVSVVYNSNFANMHGNAVVYYGHTREDVYITGVGVGVVDISISWSKSSGYFDIMSNSDTPFKMYQ